MKMTRLTLLSLALVLSLLASPGAFAKKQKGGGVGSHSSSQNKSAMMCDGGYYMWCYYEPIEACCYGGHDDCLGACGWMCGGTCDDYT